MAMSSSGTLELLAGHETCWESTTTTLDGNPEESAALIDGAGLEPATEGAIGAGTDCGAGGIVGSGNIGISHSTSQGPGTQYKRLRWQNHGLPFCQPKAGQYITHMSVPGRRIHTIGHQSLPASCQPGIISESWSPSELPEQ